MKQITTGVIQVSKEGLVLGANADVATVFGFTSPIKEGTPIDAVWMQSVTPEGVPLQWGTLALPDPKSPEPATHKLIRSDNTTGYFIQATIVAPCSADAPYVVVVQAEPKDLYLSPAVIDHYATMMENIRVGIVVNDPDGIITYCNPQTCRIIGVHSSELLGRSIEHTAWRTILPDGADAMPDDLPPIISMKTGNKVKGVVLGVYNPSLDTHRWINIESVPIKDKDGTVLEICNYLEDISEIIQDKEALSHNEARLISILNAIPEGILAIDKNGNIALSNDKMAEVLGYTKQELSDKHFLSLVPEEHRQQQTDFIHRYFSDETTREKARQSQRSVARHKGGHEVPVEVTLSLVNFSNHDYMLVSVKDITAKILADSMLEESEVRYQELIENSHDIIQSVNAEGRFIFVNKAWKDKLGYNDKDIAELSIFDIIHEESLEHCTATFMRVLGGEEARDMNIIFQGKNGEKIYATGDAIPRMLDGKAIATHTYFRDISDQIANKQLIESLSRFPDENPSPVLRLQSNGELTYANPSATRQLGVSNGQRKDSAICDQLYELLLQAKEVKSFTIVRIMELNDRSFNVTATYIPEYDYANFYLLDVTDSLQAQFKIRESEEKYRGIIENMELGLMEVDTEERIIRVYDYFCKMTGYTEQDLLGRNAADTFLMPDDIESMKSVANSRQEGIQSIYEMRIRRKDGSIFWALISGSPIKDVSGKVIGSIGIHYDITNIKRLELKLQETKTRLEALLDSQTTYVLRLDPSGTIVYNNVKYSTDFHWIYSLNDNQIADMSTTVAPENRDLLQLTIENALARPGKVEQVELEMWNIDHSTKTVLWEFVCLANMSGQPFEIQASGIDISSRKIAELSMQSQIKVLREVALISSHETRRPIANILGLIPIIEESKDNSLKKRAMEYLKRDISSLDDVVRSIVRRIEEEEARHKGQSLLN